LDLNFFDYKYMQNTFFIAACNEDTIVLDKLINKGFDYKISQFKYGKDDAEKDCMCLDSALISSLCRGKEKTVEFLINLPNVSIYDFNISIISIIAFKRDDILNKFIKSQHEALEYVNYLKCIRENNSQYDNEIVYIKNLYNI
ncbi:MAG: hypothetical protein IJH34_02315, partial [Romboutsia sp.]|nr:hypothetical protein [Romboutsia sp.]